MIQPTRFPYIDRNPDRPETGLMPFLPLILQASGPLIEVSGLLDTGATISVLPYSLGQQLGFIWSEQRLGMNLAGNLAAHPARAVVVSATIAGFAPVRLAFAWTQTDAVPVILGQKNFFDEFDICFFRSQSAFEIVPKQTEN